MIWRCLWYIVLNVVPLISDRATRLVTIFGWQGWRFSRHLCTTASSILAQQRWRLVHENLCPLCVERLSERVTRAVGNSTFWQLAFGERWTATQRAVRNWKKTTIQWQVANGQFSGPGCWDLNFNLNFVNLGATALIVWYKRVHN